MIKSNNYRWLITFLAFIGLMVNILDRSALAYAVTPIEAEFNINHIHFGIIASAFSVGYMVMVFFGGIIVDKLGSRGVWSVAAIIWSTATLLLGFSAGITMILVLRLITGMAEGPTGPSVLKAVTTYLPANERVLSFAIIVVSAPVAAIIGAPLCSFLTAWFGWRLMFIILGGLGIIWGIIWFICYRNDPRQLKYISQTELNLISKNAAINIENIHKTTLRFILTDRSLILNNWAFFAHGYLLFFANAWLPGYFLHEFHLKLSNIGFLLMIPWMVTGVLMLICGYLSDKIYTKTRSLRLSRSMLIGISHILSALFLLPVIEIHNLTVVIICLSLALGFGLAPNSCFYALNADLARDRAATSLGVMIIYIGIAGILAPIITGIISTLTGSFSSAMYIILILNILTGLLVLLFQKPDSKIPSTSRVK
jgi:ACS family hexuronate transporter-like MFS transporter